MLCRPKMCTNSCCSHAVGMKFEGQHHPESCLVRQHALTVALQILPPHSFNIGGVKHTLGRLWSNRPCMMLAQLLSDIISKLPGVATVCKAKSGKWTALEAQQTPRQAADLTFEKRGGQSLRPDYCSARQLLQTHLGWRCSSCSESR